MQERELVPDDEGTLITRDEARIANDLQLRKVPTDEWKPGSFVYVRVMTGDQRDKFDTRAAAKKGGQYDNRGLRVWAAILCCCTEDGTPLFEPTDETWLNAKSSVVLDRIFDEIVDFNGLSKKSVEREAKN